MINGLSVDVCTCRRVRRVVHISHRSLNHSFLIPLLTPSIPSLTPPFLHSLFFFSSLSLLFLHSNLYFARSFSHSAIPSLTFPFLSHSCTHAPSFFGQFLCFFTMDLCLDQEVRNSLPEGKFRISLLLWPRPH